MCTQLVKHIKVVQKDITWRLDIKLLKFWMNIENQFTRPIYILIKIRKILISNTNIYWKLVFDIAKKKKDEGIYLIGQNANDVTGSCIYIKYNGKKIFLDCGLYQNNNYLESYNINSAKFQFKPSEIDYVFIGHTHVDHIGLLPRLVKEGFTGKIIASHATAQLMKPLLYNCAFILLSEANALSFKYKRN